MKTGKLKTNNTQGKTMHIKYNQVWEDFLQDNYFPTYLRNVREIEFSEIESRVLNDAQSTSQLILDLLAGDLLIIKNVLSPEETSRIKEVAHQYGQDTPTQELSETYPVPNFHCKSHGGKVKDGYDEVGHAYFFYRWNEDTLGVFSAIDRLWDTVKIFNGIGVDGIKNNLPKDKIIDRIQLLHYPINTGEITTHCDVSRWQKTNIGINLTELGKDFDSGGFYCLDKNEQRVRVEERVKTGDAVCWIPTVFHGVEKPISNNDIDWSTPEGRWQLLAFAIQSKAVKNRVVSVSHDNFKKDPQKVLEEYMFKETMEVK